MTHRKARVGPHQRRRGGRSRAHSGLAVYRPASKVTVDVHTWLGNNAGVTDGAVREGLARGEVCKGEGGSARKGWAGLHTAVCKPGGQFGTALGSPPGQVWLGVIISAERAPDTVGWPVSGRTQVLNKPHSEARPDWPGQCSSAGCTQPGQRRQDQRRRTLWLQRASLSPHSDARHWQTLLACLPPLPCFIVCLRLQLPVPPPQRQQHAALHRHAMHVLASQWRLQSCGYQVPSLRALLRAPACLRPRLFLASQLC